MILKSRFYNKVEDLGDSVKKSSINFNKIKNEIKFYKNLPSEIESYFPSILDFSITENEVFYVLEKLKFITVSDYHTSSFKTPEFYQKFFDKAFDFLKKRPGFSFSSESSCKYLYFEKIKSRDRLFKSMGLYGKMCDHTIYNHFAQRYEKTLQRYFKLADKKLVYSDRVVYHHGDFCLSNMFMTSEYELKLIDPMGFDDTYQNMHDPLYDVAKLSHSILGNYDMILNDSFAINICDKSVFELNSSKYLPSCDLFKKFLDKYEFDYNQVRLREASLFLSMLPLHPENFRRTSAFILTAESIIDELERVM